jgi:hypothetical protein
MEHDFSILLAAAERTAMHGFTTFVGYEVLPSMKPAVHRRGATYEFRTGKGTIPEISIIPAATLNAEANPPGLINSGNE